MRGKIKEAQRFYKTATKHDETSIIALSGIIACQIKDGQYDVAKEQLDFLKGSFILSFEVITSFFHLIVKYPTSFSIFLNGSGKQRALTLSYFLECVHDYDGK